MQLFECPICKGKGMVKQPGQTLDKNFAIGIGTKQYNVTDIERLINIFKLLAIDIMPMAITPTCTKFENADYIIMVSHIVPDYHKPAQNVIMYLLFM